MNTFTLKNKWLSLSVPSPNQYNLIRIDYQSKPDINLALNDQGNRCLTLSVPIDTKIKFKQITKSNVRAYYNSGAKSIILELLDEYYHELFDDLIVSLYNVIWNINNADVYTEKFIASINKWVTFLSGSKSDQLSESEIRGLIGELVCLDNLINELQGNSLISVLNSWKGPYDETYDFESDDFAYEVKAKSLNSSEVNISNEFQLDAPSCGHLELAVVSLEIHENGYALADIINYLREKVLNQGGDLLIFYTALQQKNLNPNSWNDYNIYKFRIPSIDFYDATIKEFPSLRRSELSDSIRNIRYKLSLVNCDSFKVKSDVTPWGK